MDNRLKLLNVHLQAAVSSQTHESFLPTGRQAPIAAGRSYPMEAQPEFQNMRCPSFTFRPETETTQAVPLPAITIASLSRTRSKGLDEVVGMHSAHARSHSAGRTVG